MNETWATNRCKVPYILRTTMAMQTKIIVDRILSDVGRTLLRGKIVKGERKVRKLEKQIDISLSSTYIKYYFYIAR